MTWKDCFEIATRYMSTPARARVELTDRLFFNLLLGNNDSHGKNFALLHAAPDQTLLAPAYDLVCTELYPSLSSSLAMPIGGGTSASRLDPALWKAFAREVGVRPQLLRERGTELVESVSAGLDGLLEEIERTHPAIRNDVYPARRRQELFSQFRRVVGRNCKLVAASFR